MINVTLNCKECAREFVREVPEELVLASEEEGVALTGSCDKCIEGGHAGPLKKLIRELNIQNKKGV